MVQVLKMLSVILLCIILIMSMTISVFADIALWHSDGNTIGTWKGTQIKYAHKKLNNNPYFYFYAGGLHAIDQWSNALDITIENVLLLSEANIRVYGGTWDELTALGFTSNNTNVLGYMVDIKTAGSKTETINDKKVTVKEINEFAFVIIDKGRMSDYNYVTTHELGHALGWMGHSKDQNDVMYAIRNGITTLSERDKEHLNQVY